MRRDLAELDGIPPAFAADTARAVLLVQAVEEQDPRGKVLSLDARQEATRNALAAGSDGWLGRRAATLSQEIYRERPGWRDVMDGPAWTGRRVVGVLLLALGFGFAADALGTSRLINILAPPLLGLLAWNLAIYVYLIGRFFFAAKTSEAAALDGLGAESIGPKWLASFTRRAIRNASEAGEAELLGLAASRWARVSAPLQSARWQSLLHGASIAAVLGVVLGMYARGLVFEYRATWESTFLASSTVDAWIGTLTAPARALSGIELPAAASMAGPEGGPAAPWIHVWALTALLFVGIPRGLATLFQGLRARALKRRLPLELSPTYLQRLRASADTRSEQVQVLLYSYRPTEKTLDHLRRALLDLVGARASIQVLPSLDYGADLPPAVGAGVRVVVFSATQTPELEVHGEWLQALKAERVDGCRLLILVDESPFIERLGDDSGKRLDSRRKAWRRTFELADLPAAFVELTDGRGDDILTAASTHLWPSADA